MSIECHPVAKMSYANTGKRPGLDTFPVEQIVRVTLPTAIVSPCLEERGHLLSIAHHIRRGIFKCPIHR